jgi:hypothetical protein
MTATLGAGPSHAVSFTLNADGSYSYTPEADYVGEDTFTYTATADGDTTAPILVTITVNEVGTIAPPAAPGVDVRVEPELSGSPALVKWVAVEIGVDEKVIDIWFANTLASARDITPYNAYAKFKKAANVLQDRKGLHTDALTQLISEFASSTAPPTEEQMASVAEAIARNTEAGNVYARAGQYLDSFADYVAFLVNEMGFSEADAAKFVTAKYVDRLAKKNNVNIASFVAARLSNLYEDSID